MRDPLLLRVYRKLLCLYPRRFRERYADELVGFLKQRIREPRFRSGSLGRLRLWWLVAADLLRSLPREWLRAGAAARLGRRPNPGPGSPRTAGWATDLLLAVRTLGRRRGFTITSVATLGLGIGAVTAIFSVTDAVLLRPLPYPDAHRLVELGTRYEGYDRLLSTSPPDFFDWRDRADAFEALAASRLERRVLRDGSEPIFVESAGVSGTFFDLLGAETVLGRTFGPAAERPGAAPVVVLSHGFWHRHFGGDPDVLGRSLSLGETSFTIVGVLSPDFHPPEAIHQNAVEAWYPLSFIDDPLDERGFGFLQAVGRLGAGVSLAAARAEMEAVGRALSAQYPDNGERSVGVEPLKERTVAGVGRTLWIFLGAVGLLLAIACANVAHLFLVRASERAREMAVRTALGASAGRLARQLLAEAVVVGLLGGAVGVGVAHLGVRAFTALAPAAEGPIGSLPRLAEVAVDLRVLGFAAGLSLVTAVVFGLAPALRAGDLSPSAALQTGGRGATEGRRGRRVRAALVAGETGLALVLLFGAGILLHGFVRLLRVEPGFDVEGVARMEVALDEAYETAEERRTFFEELVRRVSGLPGVGAAGATHNLPLDGNETLAGVSVEGRTPAPGGDPPTIGYHQVLPGYFRTLGIDLLQGRDFGWEDDETAPDVAVVNESMARRFWPEGSVLGRRVRFGGPDSDGPWLTVVGVAEDIRQYALDTAPRPEIFLPFLQAPRSRMQVVARSSGPASSLVEPMRAVVRELDPGLPVRSAGTMESHVAASLGEPRFHSLLLGAFAGVALVLTFVGVYGTVAYGVELRRREMGIRIAVGAGARRVVATVVGQGLGWGLLGVVGGVGGAVAVSRLLGSYVYGVEPADPATLAGVAAATLLLTGLAAWLPARRIAGIQPMTTLGTE